MKHKIFILLLVLILCFNLSYSQEKAFISPGIKIGYEFGKNGGWTIGMEVSYVMEYENGMWGLVFNFDFLKNKQKAFIGAEYFISGFTGISIGPSILIDKKKNVHFGASFIPFFGILGYFYYDYSIFYTFQSIHNTGLYLKLPLLVEGSGYISM